VEWLAITIATSKYYNDSYYTILTKWSIYEASKAYDVIQYLNAAEEEAYKEAKKD